MTNEERYDNIRRMGEILSQVEQTLTKAEALLEEWKALQPNFEALVAYYDSHQLLKYYFDINADNITDEEHQCVVNQVDIFDVIGTEFDIADGYKELIESIDNKKWKK